MSQRLTRSRSAMDRNNPPTLTEAVGRQELSADEYPGTPQISTEELINLRTEIVAGCFDLVEQLMEDAFLELEAALAEKLVASLKIQLPELIDEALGKRLGQRSDQNSGTQMEQGL